MEGTGTHQPTRGGQLPADMQWGTYQLTWGALASTSIGIYQQTYGGDIHQPTWGGNYQQTCVVGGGTY